MPELYKGFIINYLPDNFHGNGKKAHFCASKIINLDGKTLVGVKRKIDADETCENTSVN